MQSLRRAVQPKLRAMAKLSVTAAVALALGQPVATAAPPAPDAQAAARTFTFDIRALPMNEALTRLGEQSGLTIIVETRVSKGIMAAALSGRYTADEALKQLLEPAGLKAEHLDSNTVVVRAVGDAGSESSSRNTTRTERERSHTLVAQATAQSQAPRQSDSSTTTAAEGNRKPSEETGKEAILDQVVVTGSHIRGMQVSAAPTLEFDREDIANTGYSSLEQLFSSLPQNFNSLTVSGHYAYEGGSRLATENYDRASGIDLRGLGADSTLTLINGQRRAGSSFGRIVDVSVIPLSAIERVEIVTGGRSAVYGSDAVAGVVNLVTRRQFEGVESQVEYGSTRNGAEHLQFSTITGMKFARGGFALSYDYSSDWPFNVVDVGLLTAPDRFGGTPTNMDLEPRSKRHSALLSGNFQATDSLEFHGDALYSHKALHSYDASLIPTALTPTVYVDNNNNSQYSVSLGAIWGLGAWELKVDGSRSEAHANWLESDHYDAGSFVGDFQVNRDSEAYVTVASAIADGPLFTVAGVTPRSAVGIETRRETYSLNDRSAGIAFENSGRTVRSAFAELLVPLIEQGTRHGLRKLEVTLAGRYDHYDDFGGTFNPQAGIVLQPVDTVTLRTSYSRAFRAPALIDLSPSSVVSIDDRMDPTTGGLTPVLQWTGTNNHLGPEKATTWSVGMDVEPTSAPGTKISVSYFNIAYKERIDTPANSEADQELVLERAGNYGALVNRNPNAALIADIDAQTSDDLYYNYSGTSFDRHTQNILTVFPNLVVFDDRTGNIAVENLSGIDLQLATRLDTAAGRLSFGWNGTYTLRHDRSVTVTSPSFEMINEVGKPVGFRFRASTGWERGAFAANAFVNYTESYSNPFTTPESTIASWTTVDATFRIDCAKLSSDAWLRGTNLTLSVNNLFDRAPPLFLGGSSGLRFDVANAQPLGRYLSLRLVKGWR